MSDDRAELILEDSKACIVLVVAKTAPELQDSLLVTRSDVELEKEEDNNNNNNNNNNKKEAGWKQNFRNL